MNKEKLVAAGLSEDQITSVLGVHEEAINGNYVPKHRFDEVNGELKTVKEQVTDRDEQIANLKKFEGNSEELSKKIEDLEKINKDNDEKYSSTLAGERKCAAIKFALLEDDTSKPFDANMVMSLFDLDTIEMDETGKISKGFKEQVETIRKDKSFLFNVKAEPGKPAGWKPTGTPPPDGEKGGTGTDPSVSFGKSLAQVKLGMLGVKPNTGE